MKKSKILLVLLSVIFVFSVCLTTACAEKYVFADVNGDGKIKANDARVVLRIAAGLDKAEDFEVELEAPSEAPTKEEPTAAPVTEEPTVEPITAAPTETLPPTEPTTVEPTTVEPTTVEPTTVEPTTEEPTTEEPTTEEPTTEEPTTEYIPQKMEQPEMKVETAKACIAMPDDTWAHEGDEVKAYTFTFNTVPKTLAELKEIDISNQEDGAYLMMALSVLALDVWTPENPTDSEEMLGYLNDYGTYGSMGYASIFSPGDKTNLSIQMKDGEKYKYIAKSYMAGTNPENGYTPTEPISITVYECAYAVEHTDGLPDRTRVFIDSSGADAPRYADFFYSTKSGRWYVYEKNFFALYAGIRAPKNVPHNPADFGEAPEGVTVNTMEQPVVEKGTYTGKFDEKQADGTVKVKEIELDKYKFTFKTLPKNVWELRQFDLSSKEYGAYETYALLLLTIDAYTLDGSDDEKQPVNDMDKNIAQMLEYIVGLDCGEIYNNTVLTTAPQFIHQQLFYQDVWTYLAKSYMDGATNDNGYTPTVNPDGSVSITLYQYPYAMSGTEDFPAFERIRAYSAGRIDDEDGSLIETYVDIFFDEGSGRWYVWSDSWKGAFIKIDPPKQNEF